MRKLTALLLMLVAPVAARAQHPNFSGRWTYDAAQSGSGAGAPSAATMVITQSGNTLKNDQTVTSANGTETASVTFNLDGSPSKNTMNAQGMALDLSSIATWEGSTLVVTTTADIQGNQLKTVDHWSLDASGKVLTMTTDVSVAGQSMSRKAVFNKS